MKGCWADAAKQTHYIALSFLSRHRTYSGLFIGFVFHLRRRNYTKLLMFYYICILDFTNVFMLSVNLEEDLDSLVEAMT